MNFQLEKKEKNVMMLYGMANSLGLKRFPYVSVESSILDKIFDVTCLKPIRVKVA